MATLAVLSYGRAACWRPSILLDSLHASVRGSTSLAKHTKRRAPAPNADMTHLSSAPSRVALALGIGCRRGVTVEAIESAVAAALSGLRLDDVKYIATIESKARDSALLEFAAQHHIALVAFSIDTIERFLDEHRALACSSIVRTHVGTGGVCEPCALLAVPGGHLLSPKQAHGSVTIAIAAASEQTSGTIR